MNIKVVTYNLRLDNRGDGINWFFNRTPFILSKIRSENPDVICFQEATVRIMDWLKTNLYDYTVVGIGRGSDFNDEANPVAFRKDRFELFGLDQFWLSPTPNVPGTRHEGQSTCPRICMTATLRLLGTSELVRFYNTHLDHVGIQARILGMNSVLEKIGDDNRRMKCPIVLTGDFNAEPDEECIVNANNYSEFPITDVTSHIESSFHGFGHVKKNCKIDYIYTDLAVNSPAVCWTDCHDGIYLSDHYPIAVDIEI